MFFPTSTYPDICLTPGVVSQTPEFSVKRSPSPGWFFEVKYFVAEEPEERREASWTWSTLKDLETMPVGDARAGIATRAKVDQVIILKNQELMVVIYFVMPM